MTRRRIFVFGFLGAVAVSLLLVPVPGRGFLPGRGFRPDHPACPHARRHPHRGHHPDRRPDRARGAPQSSRQDEMATIVDNIGLNQSPINLIYTNSGIIGLQDADIFISLNERSRRHGRLCAHLAREAAARCFPQVTFSFPPPDITSQILNFGAPAPLDVQVTGTNRDADRGLRPAPAAPDAARSPAWWMRACSNPAPIRSSNVDADRSRMAQMGLTETRCHQRAWPRAGRHLAIGAEFLAQSQERRLLQHDGPDAGISSWTRWQALQNLPVTAGQWRRRPGAGRPGAASAAARAAEW